MKTFSTQSLGAPIGLAFFGFVLIGLNSGANGVLLPSLSAFYHVGDAVIGLLFLVSSLGYFLSALGSGLLTERLGLRWRTDVDRRMASKELVLSGILLGLFLGFATDFVLVASGA